MSDLHPPLPGPWQCLVHKINDQTYFTVAEHDHYSVAYDISCWKGSSHYPVMDKCGYYKPDSHADISPRRAATARLVATAPIWMRLAGGVSACLRGIDTAKSDEEKSRYEDALKNTLRDIDAWHARIMQEDDGYDFPPLETEPDDPADWWKKD